MDGIRLISVAYLMALVFVGLFGAAIGAEEEKSPSTFFESLFIDPNMEFDVEEINIGPVIINMPIPKGSTFELIEDNEEPFKALMINVAKNKKSLFTLMFNIDNIEKDNGAIYNGVREYVFERFSAGKLGEDVEMFLAGKIIQCVKIFPSTFEYNGKNGYYFRTKTICRVKDRDYITNLSDSAVNIHGYFLTFMVVDYNVDEEISKTLIASWFHSLVMDNN